MKRRDVLAGMMLLTPAAALAGNAERAAAADLDKLLARWDEDEHADLKGVVVQQRGRIIAERYYNGDRADTLHDMRSAGKSITSLLLGAAVDRHLIHEINDSVQRYWPESRGSAIGDVKLSDVLTMRSGLAANDEVEESPGNESKLDEANDPLAFVLAVPRLTTPGTVYQYNSLTAYVAGLVVEKATGQSLQDFAGKVLFTPLGITRFTWARDVAGHTKGQGNLSITARDMASIGQLVLDGGRRDGRQVISANWIRDSLQAKVPTASVDPYADGYGYFWYYRSFDVDGVATVVHFASGNGGNKIYVVPSRQMVVAVTSSAYNRGYGQRRSQAILKAILAA